jgi:hypothetical protein
VESGNTVGLTGEFASFLQCKARRRRVMLHGIDAALSISRAAMREISQADATAELAPDGRPVR